MNSLGYGVILISCDWIRCHVPHFQGDGEIAPNFAEKYDGALIWHIVVTKQLSMHKNRNDFSKEAQSPYILVKATEVSTTHFGGILADSFSFKSVACFTIVRQMAPRVPSRLSTPMENVAIAAI